MKTFASLTLLTLVCSFTVVLSSLTANGAEKVVVVKITADSAAPGYEADNAMDGNPDTMWHTPFGVGQRPHPHTIDIDLNGEFEIAGFACLPRRGGGNGTIK